MADVPKYQPITDMSQVTDAPGAGDFADIPQLPNESAASPDLTPITSIDQVPDFSDVQGSSTTLAQAKQQQATDRDTTFQLSQDPNYIPPIPGGYQGSEMPADKSDQDNNPLTNGEVPSADSIAKGASQKTGDAPTFMDRVRSSTRDALNKILAPADVALGGSPDNEDSVYDDMGKRSSSAAAALATPVLSAVNNIGNIGEKILGLGPAAYDSIHEAITKQPQTSAYDWFAGHVITPSEDDKGWLAYTQETAEGNSGLIGHAAGVTGEVGTQLGEMALMGPEAGALTKAEMTPLEGYKYAGDVETARATLAARNLSATMYQGAYPMAKDVIAGAIKDSLYTSAIPEMTSAAQSYDAVYQQTGDPEQAARAGLASGFSVGAMNAIPLSAQGPLIYKIATSGLSGGLTAELARRVNNAALPENMQQDFSWDGIAKQSIIAATIGGVLSTKDPENQQVAVIRYNGIHDAAETNKGAAKTLGLIDVVSQANNSISNTGIDAAVHGITVANLKMAKTHEQLLADDPRYAAIHRAITSGVGAPDAATAEGMARDAYANEVALNASFDHYFKATGEKNQSALLAAKASSMMQVAHTVVPAHDLDMMARWANYDQPSQLQFNKALEQAIEAKAAPDYVTDKYAGDYGDDGIPNEAAYQRDSAARPGSFDAFYKASPKVEKALQAGGIRYYRMGDGRLGIRGGTSQYTTNVFAHVHEVTGELPLPPTGESNEQEVAANPKQEVHQGNAAAGNGKGNQPDGGDQGEAGQSEQPNGKQDGHEGTGPVGRSGGVVGDEGAGSVDANPEGVTGRAKPVVDALAKAGVEAPVSNTGRVSVSPDDPNAQAVIDATMPDAAEHPESLRKPLTDAQKASGNYPVAKVTLQSKHGDLDIDVENPMGSIRRSLKGAAKKWSSKMKGVQYGRFPGTISTDGEPLDVFMTKDAHDDTRPIAVISQHNPDTGAFDEPKVVMGAKTKGEALSIYGKQYPSGMVDKLTPNGKGDVVMMSRAKFMKWKNSKATDVPPHPVSGDPMFKLRENAQFEGRVGTAKPNEIEDKVDAINAKHGTSLSYDFSNDTIDGEIPKARAAAIHRSLSRIDGYGGSKINGQEIGEVADSTGKGQEAEAPVGTALGDGDRVGGSERGVRPAGQEVPDSPRATGTGRAVSDAPVFHEGESKHPVSVVGVHYSNTPGLKELDPTMAGTGSAGGERRSKGMGRFGNSGDPMDAVTSFYVRTGKDLPAKEHAVAGTHPYEARLNNLYDINNDPDGIYKDAVKNGTQTNRDLILEAIHDHGYDGYLYDSLPGQPKGKVATVFGVSGKIGVKDVSEAKAGKFSLKDKLDLIGKNEKDEAKERANKFKEKLQEKAADPLKEKVKESEEQTETPEFKHWFGDSKVTGKDGKPLVLYHGTSKDTDFKSFKMGRRGIWLTDDTKLASEYAKDNESKNIKYNPNTRGYDAVNSADRVMPVFARIEKPYTMMVADHERMNVDNYAKAQRDLFDELKTKGYDGVDYGHGVWVALGGKGQIKSSIGNSGAFSRDNGNIHMMLGKKEGDDKLPPSSEIKKENYRGPLSRYADSFYHETNAKNGLELIPGSMVHAEGRELYLSNTENMAIGQGNNKGLMMKFSAGNLHGVVNTRKPAWDYSFDNGEGEFVTRDPRQSDYQNNLESVKVTKDLVTTPVQRIQLKRTLAGLEAKGWVRSEGKDGSVTYTKPKNPMFMFTGEKAAGKLHGEALDRAKATQAENEGKMSQRDIDAKNHVATGWSKGADGKWRYEISDYYAHAKRMDEMSEKDKAQIKTLEGIPVDHVLEHPEFFKLYPEAKGVKISTTPGLLGPKTGAMFDDETNTIYMHPLDRYSGVMDDTPTSIILHELQHFAQYHEGHATGANSTEFVKKINLERIEKNGDLSRKINFAEIDRKGLAKTDPEYIRIGKEIESLKEQQSQLNSKSDDDIASEAVARYKSVAGEVEAYNTQYRYNLTDEERAALPPEFSEQTARSLQIIRFKGRGLKGNQSLREGSDNEDHAGNSEATGAGAGAKGLLGRGGVSGSDGGVSQERTAPTEISPLRGLPADIKVNGKVEHFGPNADAIRAAKEYADESGTPHNRPTTYGKLDKARAARIADEFDRMKHDPNNPTVKRAYKAMIDETLAQWQAIKRTGLKVDFIKPGEPYPYKNPREVHLDVRDNNHMWVYPTTEGFGSSKADVSGNPLLADVGESINGHPMVANDVFRIVHDYFGHIKEGVGFRGEGEENAWRSHSDMYSPLARRAMTTETRGQNSWVNYGPHGEANRTASGEDTVYADQKIGLLPEWVSHEGSPAQEREQAHHDAIQKAVDNITKSWKGGTEIHVVRGRDELPDHVRSYFESTLGEGVLPPAFYDAESGHAYLFSGELDHPDDAGAAVLHEVVGHFGLHHDKTFGRDLPAVLDDIYRSVKDTPAFRRIVKNYERVYSEGRSRKDQQNLAEEYLAHAAESGKDPKTMQKVVAMVHTVMRKFGMKPRWSEGDITVMMARVARGIREGRISQRGLESPETKFDDRDNTSTSTYRGAAGKGTIKNEEDGSRVVTLDGNKATLRASVLDGLVVNSASDLSSASPESLRALARFTQEEGRTGVAIGKADVTKAEVVASGVPFKERPGFYELASTETLPDNGSFSLRNREHGDPEEERILAKTIDHSVMEMTPWDRLQKIARGFRESLTSGDFATSLKQGWVDKGASIEKYERHANGGLLLDAAESAYKSFWMAHNNEQITAGVLKNGVPAYNSGSFESVPGRKGFIKMLEPLYKGTPNGKPLDYLFEGYAMAHRANELIGQMNRDGTSKEKLMSQPEIDKMMALDQKYPQFKAVLKDIQAFNHQLLDLAVDRGAMSKEVADMWKQNMYVPFHRSMEPADDNNGVGGVSNSVSGQKVSSKKLIGSDKKIEPVIESIIKNTRAILDKVYSNEAMRRIVGLTDGIGMDRVRMPMQAIRMTAEEAVKQLAKAGIQVDTSTLTQADLDTFTTMFRPQRPVGKDIVSVVENGKNIYYRVTDPLLLRSVTNLNSLGDLGKVMNLLLGGAKRIYTVGTTLDPRFMARIMIKDATQSWMQTGTNPNMFKHLVSNAKDILTDSKFLNDLRLAGYNGNEYYKVDELRDLMDELSGSNKWSVLNTPKKMWEAYKHVGWMSEQASRLTIAKHTLEIGGSMAEAAWQGQNTLNWQKRGDSKIAQFIMRGAPFMNAHIQGLARLYDGMLGRDVTMSRPKAVTSFFLKSLAIMLPTLALNLYNQKNKDYERLPDMAKDLYWHIFAGGKHYAIPKPFEAGAIAATLPERAMRVLQGVDTKKTFLESMSDIVNEMFGMNPIPRVLLPIAEDNANKQELGGDVPIVSQHLSDLIPEAQQTASTSPTVSAIAKHMPAGAPDALRSPQRLQHLIRGYTSSIGMYALQMADAMARATGHAPPSPASRFGGAFTTAMAHIANVEDPATDTRNRYVEEVYSAQHEADAAAKTIADYVKQGHVDDARELLKDNKTALQYRNQLHALSSSMAQLRKIEQQVQVSTTMTPQEKRDRLTKVNAMRNQILDRAAPMLDMVNDFH